MLTKSHATTHSTRITRQSQGGGLRRADSSLDPPLSLLHLASALHQLRLGSCCLGSTPCLVSASPPPWLVSPPRLLVASAPHLYCSSTGHPGQRSRDLTTSLPRFHAVRRLQLRKPDTLRQRPGARRSAPPNSDACERAGAASLRRTSKSVRLGRDGSGVRQLHLQKAT